MSKIFEALEIARGHSGGSVVRGPQRAPRATAARPRESVHARISPASPDEEASLAHQHQDAAPTDHSRVRAVQVVGSPEGDGTSTGVHEQAVALYRKAAEQGDAAAQIALGASYAEGRGVRQDYAEAAAWYRKAAEQDVAEAQYTLGLMYDHGQGVSQDCAQAEAWTRKAAEQGSAAAQVMLGWFYRQGRGVRQDDGQFVAWTRRAAEQGHALAQYSLGLFHALGQGMRRDPVEAQMWIMLAESRASGDEQATYAKTRHDFARRMTPVQLADAQQRAREWTTAFEQRQQQ